MILDKAQVVKLVQLSLTPTDAKNVARIETAMAAALEEISLRMRSKGLLQTDTETVAAGTREVTLYGNNDDLHGIFALTLGWQTDEERVLEYVERLKFIHDYDDSTATADYPARFTILGATDGKPTVRFNCPLSVQETLRIVYFPTYDTENIALARSAAAIASGTLAYFWGKGTEIGAREYENFKELTALTRANQELLEREYHELRLNKEDAGIRAVARSLRDRRQ